MMTLADYEQRLVALMDELSDLIPDGPETDEQKAKREAIEREVGELISRESEKVDRIADVVRRFAHIEDECDAEATRMKKRASAFGNKRKRLEGYVLDVMMRSGAKRLEGTRSTFTRIQNPDSVEVEDPKLLPFTFQRWTFTFMPTNPEDLDELRRMVKERFSGRYEVVADKLALREALRGGPGGELLHGIGMRPGAWRVALR